jgi:uncharacterized protein YndB with AHSA1/START domain
MEFNNQPVAKTGMLIRKPVAEVFEAFVDPDVTTKFWFNRTTGGRLEPGKTVQWHWDIYNATGNVAVKAIEENERIEIDWGPDADNMTTVEWVFESRSDDTTYVAVTNSGFTGDGDDVVGAALDSTGGFALVIAAAKAYLEHGIELNIVADRF